VNTVRAFIAQASPFHRIVFCCFSAKDLQVYEALLK